MINFFSEKRFWFRKQYSCFCTGKALETGKYLLIPQDAMEEDSVYYLGKEGDMTIGQYLEKKHNLEPVRIGFCSVKHGENTILQILWISFLQRMTA